jgi:(2Fe-2S) ferredoxin
MADNSPEMNRIIEKLGINRVKRHIFLCIGEKCCSAEDGMKTWEHLKKITRSQESIDAGIYRTKVGCLRICREGPVAVVYPDGVWYRGVTPEVCQRIVDEHLIGGKVVEEFKIAEHPLHPEDHSSVGFGEAP